MSQAHPPHALLRPRIAIPFVLVALIWGSTWYVITGQIAEVDFNVESYVREVARARTFGFMQDVETLRGLGVRRASHRLWRPAKSAAAGWPAFRVLRTPAAG